MITLINKETRATYKRKNYNIKKNPFQIIKSTKEQWIEWTSVKETRNLTYHQKIRILEIGQDKIDTFITLLKYHELQFDKYDQEEYSQYRYTKDNKKERVRIGKKLRHTLNRMMPEYNLNEINHDYLIEYLWYLSAIKDRKMLKERILKSIKQNYPIKNPVSL